MTKRFDFAKKAGCDGIEPDNVGAYEVRDWQAILRAALH